MKRDYGDLVGNIIRYLKANGNILEKDGERAISYATTLPPLPGTRLRSLLLSTVALIQTWRPARAIRPAGVTSDNGTTILSTETSGANQGARHASTKGRKQSKTNLQ